MIASVLLVIAFFVTPISNPGYMTIYILDANKKASNYPETLVANVNSTFSVYVGVENHERQTVNETVKVKVVANMNPTIPVDTNATLTLINTLENEQITENVATLSLNDPGKYFVVFELYLQKAGDLQFTGEYVALNINVILGQNASTATPTPT